MYSDSRFRVEVCRRDKIFCDVNNSRVVKDNFDCSTTLRTRNERREIDLTIDLAIMDKTLGYNIGKNLGRNVGMNTDKNPSAV